MYMCFDFYVFDVGYVRCILMLFCFFFFSSRRRHTRYWRDWSSDVCSSDLAHQLVARRFRLPALYRVGEQMLEIVPQRGPRGGVESAAHRGDLAQHVDRISAFVQHAEDVVDVTARRLEPVPDVGQRLPFERLANRVEAFVSGHRRHYDACLRHPWGSGPPHAASGRPSVGESWQLRAIFSCSASSNGACAGSTVIPVTASTG